MRAEPTGKCWCGCGERTGSFFAGGHDRKAQQALLEIVYGQGNTADILASRGFGPDNSVAAARDRLAQSR